MYFNYLFSNEECRICRYRLTRVIFRAICSQFVLNTTMENHIQKSQNFVKNVKGKVYVDDLNAGIYSVHDINFCKKMKFRFQEAKFNFRKWRWHNEISRKFMKSLNASADVSVKSVNSDRNSKIIESSLKHGDIN